MSEESFNEFKNSFSYGSRNDLSFKFMKGFSEEAGARFLQELITKLGESFDDGDIGRLIDHVVQGQIAAYNKPSSWEYDEGPFTPLAKPLANTRLGVLTSTGHFMEGEDPEPFGVKEMTQEEAAARINDFLRTAPDLSTIPLDASREQLHVRHGGYDIRGVQADLNVALPVDRMPELAAEGLIGELADPLYSFVGAAAQTPLIKKTGPQWVAQFQEAQIEAMLLVPV